MAENPVSPAAPGPSPAEVRQQLEKILSSPGFVDAGRLSPFLRFLVNETLAGEGPRLKELVIGVEVFQRSGNYDPRIDPIVRVEARRLRSRLDEYYRSSGLGDPIRVSLPKGSYVPRFEPVAVPRTDRAPNSWMTPTRWVALVIALVGVAATWLVLARYPGPAPPGPPRLAVLPFANLSAEGDSDYFSDGLTDELIDGLARVDGLRVVARSLVFQYKAKSVDVRQLARDLNITSVVEGSVRKSGDRLRITAHLTNATDGYQLWSQTFDRQLKDVFAIQEEIARSIVSHLKVQLRVAAGRSLAARYAGNIEAYNLYLKGRYQANLYSLEGMERAIAYFDSAISLDPNHAPAYAALSSVYTFLGYYDDSETRDWWSKARSAAEKAIALDRTLAEAHAALGFELGFHEWDWKAAQTACLQALELNPASSDAHAYYGAAVLLPTGRLEEAYRQLERAIELDPLSSPANYIAAFTLLAMGRFDEAIAQYERTLELKTVHPDMYWDYGMALGYRGRYQEAARAYRKSLDLSGRKSGRLGGLELYFCGKPEEARRDIPALERAAREGQHEAMDLVRLCSMLGENEKALAWLEVAHQKRDRQFFWIKVDPRLKNLHGLPRFEALVKRIGL